MSQPIKPERAFVVDIRAEGDTLEDMICIVEEYVEALKKGGTGGCIGGCTLSGHYTVKRKDITHDQYVEALRVYLENDRAEREQEDRNAGMNEGQVRDSRTIRDGVKGEG